jgi:hypothetical protein
VQGSPRSRRIALIASVAAVMAIAAFSTAPAVARLRNAGATVDVVSRWLGPWPGTVEPQARSSVTGTETGSGGGDGGG